MQKSANLCYSNTIMEKDLTKGPIFKTLLLFALPMMLGNLLQQVYNITDTIIVGRFLGSGALAAVGSTYTLMTFLTSVMIGLCMGCGALFSMHYGAGRQKEMKECMWVSFWLVLLVTLLMYLIVFIGTDGILTVLQTPEDIYELMRIYARIIFIGIGFTFLYNYFAFVLRAVGNSILPLIFLAVSSILNIVLDLWFVIGLQLGVGGAAGATVIAQGVSGIGITIAALWKNPQLFPKKEQRIFRKTTFSEVGTLRFFHLSAAIRYELWYPDDPGTGKQLRYCDHGSFCRRSQNRYAGIHAGAGIWQCLFPVYLPESWCQTSGSGNRRNPHCRFACRFFSA